ncbi:glycogen debranching protein [Achromatium sp. WMS2]|nr:glycogen debranching protein [Achromatium sp. WMS2]
MPKYYDTRPGQRYPPGTKIDADGVNFSIFSRYATSAELLLYQDCYSEQPFQVIKLDSELNHTFFNWHVWVKALPLGIHYTWRVDGPKNTKDTGSRFDPRQELLDPWALATCNCLWDRWHSVGEGPQLHRSIRAVLVADNYDWETDKPLSIPSEQMIIYELHVGNFTSHPNANVTYPGTFAGLTQKIPYLQSLGITHVELMPVMAFDYQDVPANVAAHGLHNTWGYSTHSFFALHSSYCSSTVAGRHRHEFRNMIKALHKAGIGVILDVVFNHTAEGGADGPLINFKGFGNETFYHLDSGDKRRYRDYTGCGNTVNANHPLVTSFILDCLEYWVREMHIDGFRFDLASAMARGEDGQPLPNPPVLWGIELSNELANTKIIAEAWDAAGLYQVGSFPGYRWSEWNGRYRDCIRKFVRGDPGLVGEVATRIAGSSDLYQANWRLPINSINFVTCHDGFTLWDLVSYNNKHNFDNYEHNRDGSDDNFSWNCGIEGTTTNSNILTLRRQQAKNFIVILLLSQGIPMLLSGDELLKSQNGNNNAWCQNSPLSWINWQNLEQQAGMIRFVREMIALRKKHPSLQRRTFYTGMASEHQRFSDIEWHGLQLGMPAWNDTEARWLAFTIGARTTNEPDLHCILNMSSKFKCFELPVLDAMYWHRLVDTRLESPHDFANNAEPVIVYTAHYWVAPHTAVILESTSRT